MAKPTIAVKAVYQGAEKTGNTITIDTNMDLLKRPVTLTIDGSFIAAAGTSREENGGALLVTGNINVTDTLMRLNIDYRQVSSVTIIVPAGTVVAGNLGFNGRVAAIQTGTGMAGIPIYIINYGYLFGAGGSRTGLVNGQAAINNQRSAADPIFVVNKEGGWICGGGGCGEGAATKGNIYSGGGAPYGRGYGGGGDAGLLTGGPELHRDGDNGGAIGRKGDGTRGGAAGPTHIGTVVIENYGRLGP